MLCLICTFGIYCYRRREVEAGNWHGRGSLFGGPCRWVRVMTATRTLTLPKTNSSPSKIGHPKSTFHFQPLIFRCYVAFNGGTAICCKTCLVYDSYDYELRASSLEGFWFSMNMNECLIFYIIIEDVPTIIMEDDPSIEFDFLQIIFP